MHLYKFDTIALADNSGSTQIVGRCVKYPPTFLNSGNVSKPKRFPIDQIKTLREQEAVIFQDLLYVLIGLEGFYIRYSDTFDINNSLQRLNGPDFSINKHLDPSLKDIAKRINKLGKYHFSLSSFTEEYDNLKYGQVLQAFCYGIREVLSQYDSLLVHIEQEYQTNPNYSLILLEQDLTVNVTVKLQRLYEIVKRIVHENEKRRDTTNMDRMRFESMLKSLKDDHYTGTLDGVTSDSRNSQFAKGGLILDFLQQSIDHYKGDSVSHNFLVDFFNDASVSYVEMLNSWLETGVIHDPYEEFLIHQSRSSQANDSSEGYWADKFTIRTEGLLKQFHSLAIQKKIILTGKYLNVLKECNIDVSLLQKPKGKVRTLQDSDLYLHINDAYMRANQSIIDVLFNGFHIKEFLEGLNKYFLLTTNRDFNEFMNLGVHDLRKSKDHISLTAITKHYQACFLGDDKIFENSPAAKSKRLIFNLINISLSKNSLINELVMILSARTTDAEKVFSSTNIDALKGILNSTLEANNDQAKNNVVTNTKVDQYSIFNIGLEVEVPFPLNLIITRSQMFEYQLMFRNLIYLKFVEKSLEISWKEITHQKFWKHKFENPALKQWIKRVRLTHGKMRDFVRVYMLYINADVIQANWKKLELLLDASKQDSTTIELESVFSGIKSFLSTILADSLLTKIRLAQIVNQLFAIVLLFHNFVMSLRKTLIQMDEDLLAENHAKLSVETSFSSEKNSARLRRLSGALTSYQQKYEMKFNDLMEALRFYGEVESPSLLYLFDELSLSFRPKRR